MSVTLWERRKSFRIAASGKALLQRGGRLEALYDLEDLSIGGCMVAGHLQPALGRNYDLALHIAGLREIAVPARVVRLHDDTLPARYGLQFSGCSAAVEDCIQDLTVRALEEDHGEHVLVVHSHPEEVRPLLEKLHHEGQRIVAARTARDALAILERAAEQIRVAFVAPVVGTSRAHDIMKLILRRFPQVDCVLLSRAGAQRLGNALRKLSPDRRNPMSLSRLRKALSVQQALTGSS